MPFFSSFTATAAAGFGAAGAADTATGGGGHVFSPSRETVIVRSTTSSQSMTSWPSLPGVMSFIRFTRLVPYSCEAWAGRRPARSVWPMIVTRLGVTTTSSGSEPSTLPPLDAARSTMTEPGFMDATISAVISRGAGRPGMRAVVMMMSTSLACSA